MNRIHFLQLIFYPGSNRVVIDFNTQSERELFVQYANYFGDKFTTKDHVQRIHTHEGYKIVIPE